MMLNNNLTWQFVKFIKMADCWIDIKKNLRGTCFVIETGRISPWCISETAIKPKQLIQLHLHESKTMSDNCLI